MSLSDILVFKEKNYMTREELKKQIERGEGAGHGHGKTRNTFLEEYNILHGKSKPKSLKTELLLINEFDCFISELVHCTEQFGRSEAFKTIACSRLDIASFYKQSFIEFLADLSSGDSKFLSNLFGEEFWNKNVEKNLKYSRIEESDYSKQIPYVLIMANMFDRMSANGIIKEKTNFQHRLLCLYQDLGIRILYGDDSTPRPNSAVKYISYIRQLYEWVGQLSKMK